MKKIKRDSNNQNTNQRLIITTAALVIIAGIIYCVSQIVGNAFGDFCQAAITWVLFGIGLAFALTYMNQKREDMTE